MIRPIPFEDVLMLIVNAGTVPAPVGMEVFVAVDVDDVQLPPMFCMRQPGQRAGGRDADPGLVQMAWLSFP